jgi:hypothetical protein
MSHEEENPMSDARSLTMSHAQSLSMSRALRDAMMRDYHKRMPSSLFTILKALPGSDHDRALWGLMELGQPVRHLGNSYRIFDRRFNADKSLVEYELILLPLVNQEKGISLPSVSGEPPLPPPVPLTPQQVALHRALGKPQHQSAGIVGLSR